jgi:photosystem II stability/assembly factor-like uncharacterized protein
MRLVFILSFFTLLLNYSVNSQWVTQTSNTNDHLWGVHFISNNVGWAVGGWGGVPIRKTVDGGTNWTSQWSGTSTWLMDVSFANTTHGWIAGEGFILNTTNGGTLWTKDTSGVNLKFWGIKAISQYRAIAVGNDGQIRLKRDQFNNWVSINSGVTTTLYRVAFSNQNNGCIVGDNGVVLLTTDSGESWTKKDVGTSLPLFSVAYADVNNVIIVGHNGLLLKSTNAGNTWSPTILPGEPSLRCISYPTVAKAYISGNDYIFTTKDSCGTFTRISSGTSWLLGSSFPTEDVGYLVGHYGVIKKTTTGGVLNSNTISTTVLNQSYCQSQNMSVNYTISGQFISNNVFSVQLSNSSGSFSNPTVIGSLNSTSNGTINCVIPSSTPFGSGYRIRVVSSNPVVTGTDNGNNLTINPIPTPIVSGSNIVCNESTNNYTIPTNSGRTYQWSAPSKGLIIGTSTSNSVNVKWTSTGIDTLKVRETISSTGCFSDAIYIITINSLPNPSITGLQQLCFKQSNVSYSVPNVPGNSYQWYQPTRGTIIGSTDGNSCLVNWNVASGIDSIKFRQTNLSTGCFKDVVMSVLINPLPIPVITGTANVCTKQSGLTYTVPFISGHTYQWFNPSLGQIISGGNSNIVTVNWGSISGVEQLKVRQINSLTGCTSDTTITITVNLTPTPSISGANSVCLNQRDVQYSVPNIPGHTYEWFTPVRGVIISGRYSNSCSINWNISKGTDIIRVRQINSLTGCSKDTSLSITINDTPSPTIVGLNTVCLGNSDVKYSATFVPGHTYQWSSVSNGTITSLLNSNELFIRWNKKSGIDTVKVTQTDIQTGCSTSQNYIVTINPAPTTNIIGPKEVCENQQQIVFRTSKNNGSSYTWRPESTNLFIQGSNGRDSVVINFGIKGTALLRLKEMNSFGCEKDTVFAITVNSNIQPQITTDDNKFVICKGSTKKLASSLFGDNYVWKLNGNIISNLNTREITIDKSGSYSVNVISKDCGGESNEFVIVELPNPIPVILGNKTITPQSRNVAYQVNNSSGSQYNWSIAGNGKIVSTQIGSVILVDFTDIGSAILTVTEVNSNGCVKDTSMNISISNSTNIDEELNTNNLDIFPNPMNEFGSVMVKAFIPPSTHASVSIVDMLGKTLITTELDAQNAYREIHVPISTESLINGIYMIQLRMDGNVVSKKLIINR